MNETRAFRPEGRVSTKDVVGQLYAGVTGRAGTTAPALESAGAPRQSSVAAMISLSVVKTRAYSMRRPGRLKR